MSRLDLQKLTLLLALNIASRASGLVKTNARQKPGVCVMAGSRGYLADAGATSIGKGVSEDNQVKDRSAPAPVPADNFVSRGMTRGRIKNQNLLLVDSGITLP